MMRMFCGQHPGFMRGCSSSTKYRSMEVIDHKQRGRNAMAGLSGIQDIVEIAFAFCCGRVEHLQRVLYRLYSEITSVPRYRPYSMTRIAVKHYLSLMMRCHISAVLINPGNSPPGAFFRAQSVPLRSPDG